MQLKTYFPIYDRLTPEQQALLQRTVISRRIPAGTVVHNGSLDCSGLLIVCSGQLRAYILSDEGREITLYRLFEHDCCLFTASCMLKSIQFEVTIETEKETEVLTIPPHIFNQLMQQSLPMSNFVNELMSSRFSEVMWLMEQVMWKSFDKRLALFLTEESRLEGTKLLKMTHEKIANHMGTAREVVTRMLRYFQSENLVKLTRGAIELVDPDRLEALSEE